MNTLKSILAAVAVLGLISGTTLFANEAPQAAEQAVEKKAEETTTTEKTVKSKKSTKKNDHGKKEDHGTKKAH